MNRRHRTRVCLAVAATVGALALSACTSDSNGSEPKSSGGDGERARITLGLVGDQPKAGDPVDGGTLNIADLTEVGDLNPTTAQGGGSAGGTPLTAVYDTLMKLDTESLEVVPELAESMEPDADFKTWTLTLRDGVTFSDGSPLDAQAVVDSIQWYIDNQGTEAGLLAPALAKMTVEDERTVVFDMNYTWEPFAAQLTQSPGMIVAPAAYAGAEFKPIGAGPFVLDTYKEQEELILTANKSYWAGPPHLDALRFFWPAGDDAKLDALKDGSADLAYLGTPAGVDTALTSGLPGQVTLGDAVLGINLREGRPGADPRVRQAIALAADPDIFNERAMHGLGLPGKWLFPPESKWFSGIEPPAVDLDAATKLVDEAKADGFNGKISLIGLPDPDSRTVSLTYKAMLDRVGFDVSIDTVSSVTDLITKVYVNQDYDLTRTSMNLQDFFPYGKVANNLGSESPANAGGYASPEMDALLLELRGATTDEQKKTILGQIEDLWQKDVPMVKMAATPVMHAWNTNVYGVGYTSDYVPMFQEAWKVE